MSNFYHEIIRAVVIITAWIVVDVVFDKWILVEKKKPEGISHE